MLQTISKRFDDLLLEEKSVVEEMREFTQSEKNSLLFYQGATNRIQLSREENGLDEFYRVYNAYEVINSLLFPGLENEKCRIGIEKREFAPVLVENITELLKVYCNLYSLICKYTYYYAGEQYYCCGRSDRILSLQFLRSGKTFSFLSASKRGFDNVDFHCKDGVLLLEVEASTIVEHVDVNAVLCEDSLYPQEEEILFAPFLKASISKMELSGKELQYRDMYGKPPKAKYKVVLEESSVEGEPAVDISKTYCRIIDKTCINIGKDVWRHIQEDIAIPTQMVDRYIAWKVDIQNYLKDCFLQIKKSYIFR